jgi:hypothetical protein
MDCSASAKYTGRQIGDKRPCMMSPGIEDKFKARNLTAEAQLELKDVLSTSASKAAACTILPVLGFNPLCFGRPGAVGSVRLLEIPIPGMYSTVHRRTRCER